jgi:CheY-like chemotaxis protein
VANLVLNAIEIAEAGSTVVVRTENRYVDEPMEVFEEIPPGEYVAFEVVDKGKQVSDEDLPRIFDPFFTRKVLGWGGTGLGLTVVWNVVHDHGGFVDVVSAEQGTTFTLYLPATRAVVPAPEEAEAVQDYHGNGEHILVVDDEPAQRRIARHILERLNYRVETEESGEAAIKHLESFPVDLVVLDMIMPRGLDGRETYKRLCGIQPGLKAVVASGFAHVDAIQAMREAGVKRYIEKPYTLARLGREVYAELHSD